MNYFNGRDSVLLPICSASSMVSGNLTFKVSGKCSDNKPAVVAVAPNKTNGSGVQA